MNMHLASRYAALPTPQNSKRGFRMKLIFYDIFEIIFCIALLTQVGCQSVKKGTYYEDKLTKDRVLVVFAGSEKALVARYGRKFKYH